jgi:competence protein ComEC
MADWVSSTGRSRGRVIPWGVTWDAAGWRRRAPAWADRLSDLGHAAADRLRHWAATDVGPGRLLPWLPVAFGLGIAIYFSVEREPDWRAAMALAAGCALAAFLARSKPFGFPIALGLAAITAGFAIAALKTERVSHPVLMRPAGNIQVAGFVELREERERSDRIVVRALLLEGARLDQKPDRVRVSVRKGTAPPVGAYVTFQARLNPPLAPLRPGGYDFARDLYFQGIGAVGFALGAVRQIEPPAQPSLWLRYATTISGLRDAIDARIRAIRAPSPRR